MAGPPTARRARRRPRRRRAAGERRGLAPFRTGLAETLTQQAHEVAADGLDVGPAVLGEQAPLVGMAGLAAGAVFAPDAVDRLATCP